MTSSCDSKRELYTTDSEYAFKVKRSVIVNGINVPSEKADLLSRFVAVEVLPIGADERLSESQFWAEFEADRGKLLGAFFDVISGVLRHRKPLGWAPRLSDWGELASALYEHMGWGRDLFELDYSHVEGGQHEAALESLTGDHVLRYLYDEFDDGKDVLVITPHDMWLEVKSRVDLGSRRWFPQSAESFGKEVNRLKQALSYKGFGVDRGTVGTGNRKRRALKITRIDSAGSVWASSGSVQNDITDPADIAIDKPESARSEGAGSVGSVLSTSFSGKENKKRGRRKKSFRRKTDPTDPGARKAGESGLDKPKTAGSVTPEKTDPQPTQTDPQPTPNGHGPITSEDELQRRLQGFGGKG